MDEMNDNDPYDLLQPPQPQIPSFAQQCSYGMSLSDPTGLGISDMLTGAPRPAPYLMMQHQPIEEARHLPPLELYAARSTDSEFI